MCEILASRPYEMLSLQFYLGMIENCAMSWIVLDSSEEAELLENFKCNRYLKNSMRPLGLMILRKILMYDK